MQTKVTNSSKYDVLSYGIPLLFHDVPWDRCYDDFGRRMSKCNKSNQPQLSQGTEADEDEWHNRNQNSESSLTNNLTKRKTKFTNLETLIKYDVFSYGVSLLLNDMPWDCCYDDVMKRLEKAKNGTQHTRIKKDGVENGKDDLLSTNFTVIQGNIGAERVEISSDDDAHDGDDDGGLVESDEDEATEDNFRRTSKVSNAAIPNKGKLPTESTTTNKNKRYKRVREGCLDDNNKAGGGKGEGKRVKVDLLDLLKWEHSGAGAPTLTISDAKVTKMLLKAAAMKTSSDGDVVGT